MIRLIFEISLCVVIITLLYFIITGAFCHCSTIQCPNYNQPLRSYLT